MSDDNTRGDKTFDAALTAFIMVRTTPEWLALTVPRRFEVFTKEILDPVLAKVENVRSRFFDTEFYSARVTDVWVWEAADHHAFQLVVEALRETPFWDRYFRVEEILIGVENAYANNYGREAILTVEA
ncbi:darcynin family protein [Streptomyces sp. NPDC088812]|uniref:darcynin family protein n=1 Tax=Streptomyces sp. NPDC088812 TaxID=3365905 RepID=UPI00382B0276